MEKLFDFSERDREIIRSAPELKCFEVEITDQGIRATISQEARDLIEFLRTEYGIIPGETKIDFCG